jgi:hypothetical protein
MAQNHRHPLLHREILQRRSQPWFKPGVFRSLNNPKADTTRLLSSTPPLTHPKQVSGRILHPADPLPMLQPVQQSLSSRITTQIRPEVTTRAWRISDSLSSTNSENDALNLTSDCKPTPISPLHRKASNHQSCDKKLQIF